MMRRRVRWLLAAATVLGVGAAVIVASVTLAPASGARTTDAAAGVIVEGTGVARIELPPIPEDAVHAVATFGCESTGTFRWGPADAVPAESDCGPDVLGTAARFTTFDFVLVESVRVFEVTADPGDRWTLTLRWLPDRGRVAGVNAAGETFGTAGAGGVQPDLVRVPVIDGRGDTVTGYARSIELTPSVPVSEAEALRAQIERDTLYPDGRPIIVYASDGVTVLGSFIVGGG